MYCKNCRDIVFVLKIKNFQLSILGTKLKNPLVVHKDGEPFLSDVCAVMGLIYANILCLHKLNTNIFGLLLTFLIY